MHLVNVTTYPMLIYLERVKKEYVQDLRSFKNSEFLLSFISF